MVFTPVAVAFLVVEVEAVVPVDVAFKFTVEEVVLAFF
jgi:hypothetical protein